MVRYFYNIIPPCLTKELRQQPERILTSLMLQLSELTMTVQTGTCNSASLGKNTGKTFSLLLNPVSYVHACAFSHVNTLNEWFSHDVKYFHDLCNFPTQVTPV